LVLMGGKWLAMRKVVESEVINLVDETVSAGTMDKPPIPRKASVVQDDKSPSNNS
jgi:hypothetical protein